MRASRPWAFLQIVWGVTGFCANASSSTASVSRAGKQKSNRPQPLKSRTIVPKCRPFMCYFLCDSRSDREAKSTSHEGAISDRQELNCPGQKSEPIGLTEKAISWWQWVTLCKVVFRSHSSQLIPIDHGGADTSVAVPAVAPCPLATHNTTGHTT